MHQKVEENTISISRFFLCDVVNLNYMTNSFTFLPTELHGKLRDGWKLLNFEIMPVVAALT